MPDKREFTKRTQLTMYLIEGDIDVFFQEGSVIIETDYDTITFSSAKFDDLVSFVEECRKNELQSNDNK